MRRTMSIRAISALAILLSLSSSVRADLREAGFAALAVIDQRAGHRPDGLFTDRLLTPGVTERRPIGPAAAWGCGVQLSALNAAAALDPHWVKRAADYAVALDRYRGTEKTSGLVGYQPFPGPNGGDVYYDDNEWLAMDFADLYTLTGDKAHLQRAIDAYKFAMSGEDAQLGGGIFWVANKKESKNTCSNAPAAAAALALYAATKDDHYLADAKRIRDWTTQHLQDADGLFFDNIKLNGELGRTKFSYNSALMIRTNARLFEATKDQKYLDEAVRIADAAEAKWIHDDGTLPDDGCFGHLLCEALLDLDRIAPKPGRRDRVVKVLEHLQTMAPNGTYPTHWDGWRPNERATGLLAQASAARAFLVASRTP